MARIVLPIRAQDFKEGVTAFAEKRKPEWTGL
jgi:enoyl-CoA hydratase/carnithine racemase